VTEEEKKIRLTPYGEEISSIKTFSFSVTSRCNMNCNFCFQNGRSYNQGPDMKFEEFKHIIDQIAEQGRQTGHIPNICLAGGEPFLNKDLAQMSEYATTTLGNQHVSITTNLALFPTNVADAILLFKRFGMPRFNLSIDREHLRYGKEMESRISTFFNAQKQLPQVKMTIQNVAQSKYQEKYRWPRNISRLIPKQVREQVQKDYSLGRREFYTHKKGMKEA
jgi:sulfatase maturation enzyme AslB (radical SAM superfamily)